MRNSQLTDRELATRKQGTRNSQTGNSQLAKYPASLYVGLLSDHAINQPSW